MNRQASKGARSLRRSFGLRQAVLLTSTAIGLLLLGMTDGVLPWVTEQAARLGMVITAVGAVVLWRMDGRPVWRLMQPRPVRVAVLLFVLTTVLMLDWPPVLAWMESMLVAALATWLLVVLLAYTAAGTISKRPSVALALAFVSMAGFAWLTRWSSMDVLVAAYLVAVTALWVAELLTRIEAAAKRRFQDLDRWDVLALAWLCVLSLAWWDFTSWRASSSSGLLYPLVWLGVSLWLCERVVGFHRDKVAQLNAYNEQLLRSVQERELQLNLAHYDDLQRQEREATEAERQTIYRDLHDGIGSRLVAAMYSLRSGRTTKAALENTLMSCLTDIKRIMNEEDSQEPRSIQEMFFEYCFTMDDLLSESGVSFEYEVPHDREYFFLGKTSGALMKMTQEIVANALKHSPATSIYVKLGIDDDVLTVNVREYNYKFDGLDAFGKTKKISSGAGLSNLKMRAHDIGASFKYEQRSDERRSRIKISLLDPDTLYLADNFDLEPSRRRQFLISQIGELS